MASVLLSIEDDHDYATAIKHVIDLYRRDSVRVYLLNVQPTFSRYVTRFTNRGERNKFQQEKGMQVLEPVIRQLDAAGVPHKNHVWVGDKAETIVRFAKEYHCPQIFVAKEPAGFLSWIGLGSTPGQIRKLIGAAGNFGICEDF